MTKKRKKESHKETNKLGSIESNQYSHIHPSIQDSILRKGIIWLGIPVWLLLLVLALSPFTGDPSAPIKNVIISVFGFASSIVVLGTSWWEGREAKVKKTLLMVLGGYFAILLISTFFAYNKGLAISELVLWFTLCIIAIFINILVQKESEIEWILLWVVISIGLSSVYGFLQKYGIDPFPWSTRNVEEYRGLPSSYANPNFAGHALLFGVITSLALTLYYFSVVITNLKRKEQEHRTSEHKTSLKWFLIKLIISIIAFILTLAHLYLTKMRSARIALLVAFAFAMFYLLLGKKWHPRKILGFALGISVIALVLIVAMFYILGAGSSNKPLPFDNSLNLRLNGYYGAVKMILENPILGFGPGNYRFANIPYWTNYEKLWFTLEKKRNYHVHCDPLEVWIDGGVLAVVFYFAMILLGIIGGIYLHRASNNNFFRYLGVALSSIFVAFTSDAIFGFNIRVPVSSALFFLYLGISQFSFEDEEIKLSGKIAKYLSLLGLILCSIAMIYQILNYYADVNLQRARGGIYWAQEYEKQGQSQAREKLLDKAIEFAETGLKYKFYDPRFSEIPGRICMMKNDYKTALQHFDRALLYDKYNPDLWTTRTQCCLNWIHYANNQRTPLDRTPETILHEAEQSALNAIKYNDRYPDAYEGITRTLYFKTLFLNLPDDQKKELYSKAIEYGKKALENGVQQSLSLLQILIMCYQGINDYYGCADVLQKALSIDMENIDLWSRYATVMKQIGYPPDYLNTLEKVYARLKVNPKKTAPTLAQLALMIYQERMRRGENTKKSITILEDTLKINPSELSTWGAYIFAIPKEKRLDSLRSWVKKFSTSHNLPTLMSLMNKPDANIDWLEITKEVLNSINNDEKAKIPYKTQVLRYSWIAEICFDANANNSNPDKPEIFANLADIYLKLRFDTRALSCFQFAQDIQSDTNKQRVLYLWAETLYKKKDYQKALEKLRESLNINSEHLQSRVLLVQTLIQLDRTSEANLEFQALKKVLPENSATIRSLQQMFQRK